MPQRFGPLDRCCRRRDMGSRGSWVADDTFGSSTGVPSPQVQTLVVTFG